MTEVIQPVSYDIVDKSKQQKFYFNPPKVSWFYDDTKIRLIHEVFLRIWARFSVTLLMPMNEILAPIAMIRFIRIVQDLNILNRRLIQWLRVRYPSHLQRQLNWEQLDKSNRRERRLNLDNILKEWEIQIMEGNIQGVCQLDSMSNHGSDQRLLSTKITTRIRHLLNLPWNFMTRKGLGHRR